MSDTLQPTKYVFVLFSSAYEGGYDPDGLIGVTKSLHEAEEWKHAARPEQHLYRHYVAAELWPAGKVLEWIADGYDGEEEEEEEEEEED